MPTSVEFRTDIGGKQLLIDVETIVGVAWVSRDTTDLILANGATSAFKASSKVFYNGFLG